MNISTMAALGSSFAAGPGIRPVADARAMRSEGNYAHLTAQALGARLIDATVSGATTATILTKPQRLGRTVLPPQIESIDARADLDLVTITAGGNDLGYLATMLKTAFGGWLPFPMFTSLLGQRLRRGATSPVSPDRVEQATAGLVQVVEEVVRRAPRARILLVDYLTIIGPATRPSPTVPFSEDELTSFRDTAALLASAFRTAARESAAELVEASAISADHAVDAPEPWVNGFRASITPSVLASCFHPNAAGMRAVSKAIVERLEST